MADFNRSSSRFSRGGGNNGGNSSGGSRGGYSGGSRSGGGYSRGGSSERSEGRSNGGGYSRRSGGRSEGGDKKYPFSRIGTLRVPKSASDDMADYVENELKGSDIRLNAQIYLGKGGGEVTLRNGDILLISFKPSQKDQDFVVGTVSIKNED